MNKKSLFIIIAGLIFAIAYISWGIYSLNTKGDHYDKYVKENYSNITGKIIRISEDDKNIALKKLEKKEVTDINLAVASYSENSDPKYYLLYDLSGIYNEELLALDPDSVAGRCINMYVLPDPTEDVATNSYADGIQTIYIEQYEIVENTDCYANSILINPIYTEYENLITITSRIKSATRPAYDIAYDYEIAMTYDEAKSFGYADASGRKRENTEIVEIPITTKDLNILEKLEETKRANNPLKLQGVFEWGYAETMVFNVISIE